MIDTKKLNVILQDNRTSDRVRLIFLLLEKGLTIKEIIHLSAENLPLLNEIPNGELLFKKYTARKGIMEAIIKNNLLFPSKAGDVLTEKGILNVLRRACRLNGFKLHDIGFHGLSNESTEVSAMSLNELQKYIEDQHKKQ